MLVQLTLILGLALGSAASAQTCSGRLVVHAVGETCVPETVTRVVALETSELDSAVALGVLPVGAGSWLTASDPWPEYLEADLAGTTYVGLGDEPNLEAVAALEPDLILGSRLRHEALYEQLSKIAPTVFTETVGGVWKENLLLHGEALGKGAEAQRLLDAYEARTRAFEAALGDARPEVSIVRFLPGEIRVYQKATFSGTILEDVGLPRPPSGDVDDFAASITAEGVPEIGGDVIFTTVYGPQDETDYALVTEGPLWKGLASVEAGNVYRVPEYYWMLGVGVEAANRVLGDLERYILNR
jgi:iron complex transport system substrate-binding protein